MEYVLIDHSSLGMSCDGEDSGGGGGKETFNGGGGKGIMRGDNRACVIFFSVYVQNTVLEQRYSAYRWM